MHFVGPDQLHGFEERLTTDVYPAGLDWVPDWRLEDREHLAWYHDMSSVARAGPVRATLQTAYDEEVAFRARRALVDAAREPDRPFLLVASFTHPHDPYEVPPALWARYDGVEIDGPAVPWLPPEEQDAHSARLARMIGAERPPDEARVLAARRGYYAAISLVDDHVGTLLATLDEVGLADDTIVLVTSDHGDLLGERGLWYKMSPLDPSARVPLLVHAPRRFAAGRVAAPVSLLDLAPTLVELAGGDPAEVAVDGESLLPLLRGDAGARHGDVALEYLAEGVRAPQVTLVRGRHKLVRCPGDPDLLLDLEADPQERDQRRRRPGLRRRAGRGRRGDRRALGPGGARRRGAGEPGAPPRGGGGERDGRGVGLGPPHAGRRRRPLHPHGPRLLEHAGAARGCRWSEDQGSGVGTDSPCGAAGSAHAGLQDGQRQRVDVDLGQRAVRQRADRIRVAALGERARPAPGRADGGDPVARAQPCGDRQPRRARCYGRRPCAARRPRSVPRAPGRSPRTAGACSGGSGGFMRRRARIRKAPASRKTTRNTHWLSRIPQNSWAGSTRRPSTQKRTKP